MVKRLKLGQLFAGQRLVKALHQQQVAVSIHRQTRHAFYAAMKHAVGIGLFCV